MLINASTYHLLRICVVSLFSFTTVQAEILPASTDLMVSEENNSLHFEQYTQTRTPNTNQSSEYQTRAIQLDTGYSLHVQKDLDIYVATRLTTYGEENNSIALSGGVDFQLTPQLVLTSGLAQQTINFNSETDTYNNQTSLEFSSTYHLNNSLHFFATYDHQIERNRDNNNYQFGVGFRF